MLRHLILLLFLTLSVVPAWAEKPIEIMYHQRAPYSMVEPEGKPSGLVAAPIHRALEHAKISTVWIDIPPKRQLFNIQANKKPVCGLGWFKNPEREQYAKFSLPVYQDSAMIGLALKSTGLPESTTLVDLFSNHKLMLLIQSGYSYGLNIDRLIRKMNPIRFEVTVDNQKLFKMLNYGRGDYLFMSTEEAYELILGNDLSIGDYQFIYFEEMKIGGKRYLMCSKKVSDNVLLKLNEWLNIHVDIP